MIKISIVIPVYNQKNHIEQCLTSALSQTIKEKEIICVDDGSTDSTYDILKQYEERYSNIIVIRQKNRGAAAARNLGLKIAQGEFVHFMDADDYYAENNVLKHMYTAAIDNSVNICGGSLVADVGGVKQLLINSANTVFKDNHIIKYKDFQQCFFHVRYIYKNDMLKKNNIIYPEYRTFEDPPFLVHAMLNAGIFYALKEPVYVYRTEYKANKYSVNGMVGWLMGITDVLELSQRNGLEELVQFCREQICNLGKSPIMGWAVCKSKMAIASFINDINTILGETVLDIQALEIEYSKRFKSKNEFIQECRNAKAIIIYGAGQVGKRIARLLDRQGIQTVIGYAVSHKAENTAIGKYKVVNINEYSEYKKTALIIVATIKNDYKIAMKKELKILGFNNISKTEIDQFSQILNLMEEEDQCYYFS